MAEPQDASKHHLNKTTNTMILDYVLWLSAKTILEEAATPIETGSMRTRGRRLVGLTDGLILTFDITNRPKFNYPLLTRRLDLAALVILFVYRDSRSQYITRRSSETSRSSSPQRTARTSNFLNERCESSVIKNPTLHSRYSTLVITDETTNKAKTLFGIDAEPSSCTNQYRKSSLKDALEHFMAVSASSFSQNTAQPATIWTKIANDFSMFAALESILVLGLPASQSINECFCYGPLDSPDSGDVNIDAMFRADETQDFAEFAEYWESCRSQTLGLFAPASPSDKHKSQASLEAHLIKLLQVSDWPAFRARVIDYLVAVSESLTKPELTKYSAEYGPLDKSILRAPGMIAIRHEDGDGSVTSTKRARISA